MNTKHLNQTILVLDGVNLTSKTTFTTISRQVKWHEVKQEVVMVHWFPSQLDPLNSAVSLPFLRLV